MFKPASLKARWERRKLEFVGTLEGEEYPVLRGWMVTSNWDRSLEVIASLTVQWLIECIGDDQDATTFIKTVENLKGNHYSPEVLTFKTKRAEGKKAMLTITVKRCFWRL